MVIFDCFGTFSGCLGSFFDCLGELFDCFRARPGIVFRPWAWRPKLTVFRPCLGLFGGLGSVRGASWGLFDCSRGARPLSWQPLHRHCLGSTRWNHFCLCGSRAGLSPAPFFHALEAPIWASAHPQRRWGARNMAHTHLEGTFLGIPTSPAGQRHRSALAAA